MLSKLRIQNFALIDKLEIEFDNGLNIITGATGAGKSILIGALDLALGGRASEEIIRDGESAAIIEAEFNIESDSIKKRLNAIVDFPIDFRPLVIRREYKLRGGGRAFIGESQVNLTAIKAIASNLADILGQHSHQTLLDPSTHRVFLDIFAGLESRVADLKETYAIALKQRDQLRSADRLLRENSEKIELLNFQISEIEQTRLEIDEEEKLKAEKKLLENAQKIRESVDYAKGILAENEASAIELVGNAIKNLTAFAALSDDIRQMLPKLTLSIDNIRESVLDLSNLASSLDFDPGRLEFVNDRLAEIFRLKKKYGADIPDILNFAEKSKTELSALKSKRLDFADLQNAFQQSLRELNLLASEISNARAQKKPEFENAVKQSLASMGMSKSKFVAQLTHKTIDDGLYRAESGFIDGDDGGFDIIEFQFSANPGEELKPLARIASGGEISRVMLSIKNSISEKFSKTCEIFDEVDVGISGEVAFKVASQLKKLSKNNQVICITHLPQIASQADHHYRVYKQIEGGRNITRIKKLTYEERIKEIAGLISGKKITETALAGAKKLLEESGRSN